jgi:imidazolonepropionase-like amidohydrolase
MQRAALVVVFLAGLAAHAAAQDLVITNARIIVGTGQVIERGSVVVRGGRITSVGAAAAPAGVTTIDAQGMTVMPGFIDAHRHPVDGNPAVWLKARAAASMQEYLDAGFTTVLSAGDSPEPLLQLRQQIDKGSVKGPRLVIAGRVPLARPLPATGPPVDPARSDRSRAPRTRTAEAVPGDEIRGAVAKWAKLGVDAIKTNMLATPGGPEIEALKIVVAEAKRHGLPTITHAVTVLDTLAAVEAGSDRLVHTPHIGRLDEDAPALQKIAKSGIPMTSTLAIFIPHFGADNTPLFRDREPFPWTTISSGGQGPVNARLLWNAGLTMGYGTDADWHPRETLSDELRALSLMFSPRDIVTILTKNAAVAALRERDAGTLDVGKFADLVMLDGNPLEGYWHLMNPKVVIKGGVVMVDTR